MSHSTSSLPRTPAAAKWWVSVACVAVPTFMVMVLTLGFGVPVDLVFNDAASYTGEPFYLGLFSNLGVLLWWVAAVCCALAACVLPRDGGGFARSAMTSAALLSGWLALDDLALLHEEVLPTLLGVSELVIAAAYGSVILWYLWRFRAVHLTLDTGLLAAALLLVGLGTAVDVVEHMLDFTDGQLMVRRLHAPVPPMIIELLSPGFGVDLAAAVVGPNEARESVKLLGRFLEEIPEFAGTAAWAAYHARAAWRLLCAELAPAAARADPAAAWLLRQPARPERRPRTRADAF